MRVRILAVAMAFSLAVAGCSTTSNNNNASAGGTLTVASPYPTENLDPHGAAGSGIGTQIADQAIFSRLVRPNPEGKIVSDLASKWQPNADATQWTFTLREDAKFSDGSAVEADDVLASIKRIVDLKGPNASSVNGLTVTAPDPHQVVIAAPKPEPALLGKLTLVYITPADVSASSFTKPVGSGPFVVDKFTPGQTVELVPNKHYFGGVPKLDRVVLRVIPEISARMTALKTGEIQATWGIPDDQLSQLSGDSSVKMETVAATSVYTMWFNSSRPALAKPEVRRALWQAVDFATIIKSLYPQTGQVSESVLAASVLGYAPQEPVKFDQQAARTALQTAGFDFSKKLQLQFSGAEHRQFIQAVAADLAKIGVQVEPAEKESAVFLEDLLAMRWDINFQSLSTPTFDAATNLGRLYTCAAKRNGYCNPELDTILAEAGSISDTNRRKDLYAQATKIIWDDAVGMYPMALQIAYAWRSEVKGLTPSPSYLPDFSTVTLS